MDDATSKALQFEDDKHVNKHHGKKERIPTLRGTCTMIELQLSPKAHPPEEGRKFGQLKQPSPATSEDMGTTRRPTRQHDGRKKSTGNLTVWTGNAHDVHSLTVKAT